jgi:hypothetical protein
LPYDRGESGQPNLFAAIPLRERPNRAPETTFDQLLRLDSVARPGLTEFEFKKLFVKCRCGKVTTRRVFNEHICAIIPDEPAPVDVDLTSDADDEDLIDLTGESDDSLIDLTVSI